MSFGVDAAGGGPRRRVPLAVVLAVALPLLAALLQFGPWPTAWSEWLYLTLLYPTVSAVTSRIVDATGLSVSAGLLILLLLIPLLQLLLAGRKRWSLAGATLAFSLAALALLFPITFGLAYRLEPLEQRMGLTSPLSVAQRQALEAWVVAQLELVAAAVPHSTEQRWLVDPTTAAAASRCVAATTISFGRSAPQLPQRLKYLPPGSMLRFGFAGVASPWLLEPHVDAGLTPTAALGVALHEFAHSAGFAPEAEAETVGLVAGLFCEDATVRYAAQLRLAGALAAAMPPEAARSYTAAWPLRAVSDVRAAAAAARSYRLERLAQATEGAYALYLQAQGGREGLGEYQRGTELTLRYLAKHLDP